MPRNRGWNGRRPGDGVYDDLPGTPGDGVYDNLHTAGGLTAARTARTARGLTAARAARARGLAAAPEGRPLDPRLAKILSEGPAHTGAPLVHGSQEPEELPERMFDLPGTVADESSTDSAAEGPLPDGLLRLPRKPIGIDQEEEWRVQLTAIVRQWVTDLTAAQEALWKGRAWDNPGGPGWRDKVITYYEAVDQYVLYSSLHNGRDPSDVRITSSWRRRYPEMPPSPLTYRRTALREGEVSVLGFRHLERQRRPSDPQPRSAPPTRPQGEPEATVPAARQDRGPGIIRRGLDAVGRTALRVPGVGRLVGRYAAWRARHER